MRIDELMTPDPVCVGAEDTLIAAVERLREHDIRHLLVTDRQRLIGVISERDLLEITGWNPDAFFDTPRNRELIVRDHMSATVESVAPDSEPAVASTRMVRFGIGCLPVVNDEKPVGIVTETDLLALVADAAKNAELPDAVDPPLSKCTQGDVVTIDAQQGVADAVELCRRTGIRHLPVVHDGWFVGVLSDRDLRADKGSFAPVPVAEIMSKDIQSLSPDARLSEAAGAMARLKIGAVPVLRDGRLEGIVTVTDVLRVLGTFCFSSQG